MNPPLQKAQDVIAYITTRCRHSTFTCVSSMGEFPIYYIHQGLIFQLILYVYYATRNSPESIMRIKTMKKVTFYEKTSERGTTVKRGFFFYFAFALPLLYM